MLYLSNFRNLPSLIYPRMLGYAASLTMHVTNVVNMTRTFEGDVLQDADVKRFHDDQLKFLTVWNIVGTLLSSLIQHN